jgi:hypothetical protein
VVQWNRTTGAQLTEREIALLQVTIPHENYMHVINLLNVTRVEISVP